jgi:hypothetical protein
MNLCFLFHTKPALGVICAAAAIVTLPIALAQGTPEQAAANTASTQQAIQQAQEQRSMMELLKGKLSSPSVDKAATMSTPDSKVSANPQKSTGLQSHPLIQKVMSAPVSANFGAKVQRFDPATYSVSTARINADGSISTACNVAHDHASDGGNYGR